MNTKSQLELLAPAGDGERLASALLYGADAVYLAGPGFSMRSRPHNFTWEQLFEAKALCRAHDAKLYVTCNTLPRTDELDELPDYLARMKALEPDALIIADVGVFAHARRALDIPLHVSTQAGVVNHLAACEWHDRGAQRVILARELTLHEIRVIRDRTPAALELESFVHGAMCVSFSGRCLLSNYLTGRDANRGECAQPCRWNWALMEEKREGDYYPAFEDEDGTYILNAKDLCMLAHIDKLARAGVSSCKIEGRAKSNYYTAVVVNAYRLAIDSYLAHPDGWAVEPWLLDEVRTVSHRQYTTGFYLGDIQENGGQLYSDGGYIRDYSFVATVEGSGDGMLTLCQRGRFAVGDELEVVRPGAQPAPITVERLFDEQGEEIDVAPHPMMICRIPCSEHFPPGSVVRKRN